MISNQLIDQVIADLDQEGLAGTDAYEEIARAMPAYVQYLTDDDTHFLTDREHEYLLYLGEVLHNVFGRFKREKADIDLEQVHGIEETIWAELVERSEAITALERSVPDSEALYDFLTDALGDLSELPFLTQPGAEVIFTKLCALAIYLEKASDL